MRSDSLKEIDYLKAFAIILVVFYHALFAAKLFMGNMFYMCLNIALVHIHVPLFILIAGYLCHKQDIGQFFLKKIHRIFIPYLFMSVLKLLYNNLISADHIHEGDIWFQIYDALICGGMYWFCYCLLVIFAAAPLLWDRRKRIWCTLAVLTVVNIFLQWNDIYTTRVLQIHEVIYHMPFFLVGMLLWSYRIPEKIRKTNIQYVLLAAALCTGSFCGILRFGLDIYDPWLIDAFFSLSVIYLLYFAACRIKGRGIDRILRCIGKYSLQIMFFDSFFRIFLYWLVYLILDPGITAVIIVTVLDIVLSCFTCMAVKKVPVLSKLVGL